MLFAVLVDQTIPMTSQSQAVPNPMSLEVADEFAWSCCRDMIPDLLPLRLSRNRDRHPVPEIATMRVRFLNKEGEGMENDDGGLDRGTSWTRPRILDPMDEVQFQCYGFRFAGAWNSPIRGTLGNTG